MQGVLAERGRRLFSGITLRRIRRGVFKSVADLEDAIKRYIADHNRHEKHFARTKTAFLESSPASLYLLNESVHWRPDSPSPRSGLLWDPPWLECLRPSHPAYSSHSSTQWVGGQASLNKF
jgi:hypothetical protein